MISKAHRTSSMVSLARILPLDLRAKENDELYKIKIGKPLPQLPGRELAKPVSPYTLLHPPERQKLSYSSITTEDELKSMENEWPCIYTDGSKIAGRVGAAITCWKEGQEIYKARLKLGNHCSVYQAELAAILKATEVIQSKHTLRKANILSDSQSALECLTNPNTLHPLAAEILDRILEIRRNQGEVRFFWIKENCGIPGNERAVELGKSAAETSKQKPAFDCFPLSFARRLIRDNIMQNWQERYTTAETGRVTKKFFSSVTHAYKTMTKFHINNLRYQIFTGHGGFKAYLHKFKVAQSPCCDCDQTTPQIAEFYAQF
ncbi:unnamed protein product [Parnassius apollo]|uniref:(apollo) hypothetical protein n=1 Tax=Parnassius apollo TaxID=110799 RepID=A0A8S3WGX6_PARAO|nr:unnamed protein product [Parnassius apollo]